jgi:hypothetical protein
MYPNFLDDHILEMFKGETSDRFRLLQQTIEKELEFAAKLSKPPEWMSPLTRHCCHCPDLESSTSPSPTVKGFIR